MKNWKKLSQQTEAVGYRVLVTKKFEMPDGHEREFTTYNHDASQEVAVIALTPDNQVVIARQFRPGPEKVFDELPGGAVDPGEDIEAAAKRELLEETGYTSDRFEYIGSAYRNGYNNGRSNYFIAYDCKKTSEQNLDAGEFIEVSLISIAQLIDNAKNAKMVDAPAVLLAQDVLNKLI